MKPKSDKVLDELEDVNVREYVATAFVFSVCSDIFELLRKHFPEEWREIAVISITRFFYQSP